MYLHNGLYLLPADLSCNKVFGIAIVTPDVRIVLFVVKLTKSVDVGNVTSGNVTVDGNCTDLIATQNIKSS